ncbi:class I SAM-dependent methyltransferase [Rossellomorea aquimaris]|uniref:class I SAM-dependent methyltransferase n=1 Tax=Rossellomorea aquimaris TaxID=189382 RepID=UPI0007D09304|nr:class I SAM-dependent methyltransferase [Rossellomorea aquimaris]
MFVTTCGKVNPEVIRKANQTAEELGLSYIPRNKRSIPDHMNEYDQDCLVIGKERAELYTREGKSDPFFFHPNSASFRIKRVLRNESDPLIEIAELEEGMSFLDCTLGLASDSIIASHVCGESGEVVGIEANKYISHIIAKGLKEWKSPLRELNEAMSRITVMNGYFEEVLRSFPDNRYDVVYFDPMFEEALTDSNGINPIRNWAHYSGLSNEVVTQAKRVAKKRVILKEHYQSPLFDKLNFKVQKRPSSKFHFGVITV